MQIDDEGSEPFNPPCVPASDRDPNKRSRVVTKMLDSKRKKGTADPDLNDGTTFLLVRTEDLVNARKLFDKFRHRYPQSFFTRMREALDRGASNMTFEAIGREYDLDFDQLVEDYKDLLAAMEQLISYHAAVEAGESNGAQTPLVGHGIRDDHPSTRTGIDDSSMATVYDGPAHNWV